MSERRVTKRGLRHAYTLGRRHYDKQEGECPYESEDGDSQLRSAYWDGWYDAKFADRLGLEMKTQFYWQ